MASETTHRLVETNGMHIAEQGSGPTVMLCAAFQSFGIPGGTS